MKNSHRVLAALLPVILTLSGLLLCSALPFAAADGGGREDDRDLDRQLTATLRQAGFTGSIETQLEPRLGRRINQKLAEVGQMLWFDTLTGINDDNTCGGCHSPTTGFGDTQSIAIGIDNNGIVGPSRQGPRNQRRTPMAINTAFFPTLMWNSRFCGSFRESFRQSGRFPISCTGRIGVVVSAALADGTSLHSSHRADGSGGISLSRR